MFSVPSQMGLLLQPQQLQQHLQAHQQAQLQNQLQQQPSMAGPSMRNPKKKAKAKQAQNGQYSMASMAFINQQPTQQQQMRSADQSPVARRIVSKRKSNFFCRQKNSSKEGDAQRLGISGGPFPGTSAGGGRPFAPYGGAADPSGSGSSSAGAGGLINVENLGAFLRQKFIGYNPTSEMLRVAAREYIGGESSLDLLSILYSSTVTPNSFLGLASLLEVKQAQAELKEYQMSRKIASAMATNAAAAACASTSTSGNPNNQPAQSDIIVFSHRLLASMPPKVVEVFGAEPPRTVDLAAEAQCVKYTGTPEQCANQLALLLIKKCIAEERLRIISAAESKTYISIPEQLREAIFDIVACATATESEETFYETAQIHEATMRNASLSEFLQRRIQSFLHEHRRSYNHGKPKCMLEGKEVVPSMYEAHQWMLQQRQKEEEAMEDGEGEGEEAPISNAQEQQLIEATQLAVQQQYYQASAQSMVDDNEKEPT